MTDKRRKISTTALKIIVSVALTYFIFTKINFSDVLEVLKRAKAGYLILAILLFIISKALNAFRLNLYFHAIGVQLTQISNLKLYLLGMFYNLFLPGGIGGDAYKGYVIQKKYRSGTKKVVAVLLLDRLSGMLFIFIYACLLAIFLPDNTFLGYNWLLGLAIPIGIAGFWFLNKIWFSYTLKAFWGSFIYSGILQATQLLAVVCILRALSITLNEIAYLFVFLISSIVSVVPLTIGGIGSREVTFLYGAKWLGLNADSSIAISMVFFLITALVSLFGIYHHFNKPRLEVIADQ